MHLLHVLAKCKGIWLSFEHIEPAIYLHTKHADFEVGLSIGVEALSDGDG